MHMKQLFLFAVAMFVATASFAQEKGDMCISGTISLELGSQTTTVSSGSHSISASQPLSTEFNFAAEYGYFVADNVKVAMALAVPFTSSPTHQLEGSWLADNTAAFTINPNVAYYLRFADRFYYTPEVGVAFSFGSGKSQLTKTETVTTPFWGWNIYTTLLALEYKVTDNMAIGASVGSLVYGSIISTSDPQVSTAVSQFKFDLNNSSLHFRFYF